ncbi:MAG TPA: cyclic nucleotide-binding domain-containing protein, partial [bacterium]|nr:cyclic nucleotide-binding domain-containing protein [bacterium]
MSSDEYKLTTLASSALFKNIPEDALRRLLPHFTLKVYPTNTVIFEDGNTQPDGMYIIAKGFVKIFKSVPGEEVRQQAVAVLPAGSYFGEMALLDEEVRSAGAVTM